MPRISEITDDGGDPTLKPIFDRQRELFGDTLNTTRVMAHCPPILRAAGLMGQAIEQSGQLPKALLPLIYLGSPRSTAVRFELISTPSVWRKPKVDSTRSRT